MKEEDIKSLAGIAAEFTERHLPKELDAEWSHALDKLFIEGYMLALEHVKKWAEKNSHPNESVSMPVGEYYIDYDDLINFLTIEDTEEKQK